MKKTLILIMAILMVASVALISVGAETSENTEVGPLIITEILNNPSGTDYYEYMEIMNIGDEAIDLYDYKFWYTASDPGKLSDCKLPTPGTSKWNVFASAPGENILEPGEIAIVFFVVESFHIPSDTVTLPADVEWFRKDISEAEKSEYSHTLTDYQGNIYAYNVDAFKNMCKNYTEGKGWILAEAFDTTKVIICDNTIDIETPSAEDIEAGKVGNKVHFNMANASATKAVKFWITDNGVDVIDENTKIYCSAGVESGAAWSAYTFTYRLPETGYDMVCDMLYPGYYTPGYLLDLLQYDLINIRNSIDPNKYPDTAVVVTTTYKEADQVTTEEVTNPHKTDDPNATTNAPTTKAPTTSVPTDTTVADDGGCGGFTVAAQLIALLSAAVAFVAIKKKS